MTPEAFREALEQRGLDRQHTAAAALRTTQGTISRWLAGVKPIPPLVELALQTIPSVQGRSRSAIPKNGSKAKRTRN